MATLRKDRQLIRRKRGVEPGKVFIRQEEIVLIDDDADVGVGAQTGAVGPQVTGDFQRVRRRQRQAPRLIIRNRDLLEIVLVGVLKDFLVHGGASQVPDLVMQDSLIIAALAAEDNIPQHESKRQSDEKLGLDGIEGQ